jgi:hypothetical protein
MKSVTWFLFARFWQFHIILGDGYKPDTDWPRSLG